MKPIEQAGMIKWFYDADYLEHGRRVAASDYSGAVDCLERCLAKARNKPEPASAAYILQRIGQLHWKQRWAAGAFACFDAAIQESGWPIIALIIAQFLNDDCKRPDLAALYARRVLSSPQATKHERARASALLGFEPKRWPLQIVSSRGLRLSISRTATVTIVRFADHFQKQGMTAWLYSATMHFNEGDEGKRTITVGAHQDLFSAYESFVICGKLLGVTLADVFRQKCREGTLCFSERKGFHFRAIKPAKRFGR